MAIMYDSFLFMHQGLHEAAKTGNVAKLTELLSHNVIDIDAKASQEIDRVRYHVLILHILLLNYDNTFWY